METSKSSAPVSDAVDAAVVTVHCLSCIHVSIHASIYLSNEQRYLVLSESEDCFCVLRVYSRAVRTAWGMAPLDLRLSIPIWAIESVQLVTSIASKGELVVNGSPLVPLRPYICR